MGCDYTPNHEFEKNREYFLLGILAYNMVQIMKLFYLGNKAKFWMIKTMRYQFINMRKDSKNGSEVLLQDYSGLCPSPSANKIRTFSLPLFTFFRKIYGLKNGIH